MIEPTTNKPALAAEGPSTDAVTFASEVEQAGPSSSKAGATEERDVTRPNTRAGAASINTTGLTGERNRNFFRALLNLLLLGWIGKLTGVFKKKKKD